MSARAEREYAGLSDVGRSRAHNEDAVLLSPPLFAVADGLGGHQAGEVASTLAIETLMENAPAHVDAKALGRAVRTANKAVIEASKDGTGREGMGTTLTAAIVEGQHIAIAQVGDSRAYVLHAGTLERVTEDHSMVADMIRQGTLTEEESRVHPNRSVITRALGSDPNMYADTFEVIASPGDRLLLCSDGLTGMLTDDQILDVLEAYQDPQVASRALIDAANAAGGQDNISVVVVEIADDGSQAPRRSRTWLAALIWTLAAIALIAGAAWALNSYARSQAYVIDESGLVVLYRGIPGEFAGYEPSWLEEETTITARHLGPATSARLVQGIQVESVDAGYELLTEYRVTAARVAAPSSESTPTQAATTTPSP